MKKISQAQLQKMVSEKNLSITRNKAGVKPEKKPLAAESPGLSVGIMVKSGEVVSEMAQSLAASANKMAESNIMVAQIVKTIQDSLNEQPKEIVETPKKKKWRFTPVRDYDQITKYIDVEEL